MSKGVGSSGIGGACDRERVILGKMVGGRGCALLPEELRRQSGSHLRRGGEAIIESCLGQRLVGIASGRAGILWRVAKRQVEVQEHVTVQ